MKETVDEVYTLSLLYDYYGVLLSDSKKRIFEDYVLNDYSLSEIAENEGISRQGVHEIVKRCEKEMKKFEDALHLLRDQTKAREELAALSTLTEQLLHTKEDELIYEIQKKINILREIIT